MPGASLKGGKRRGMVLVDGILAMLPWLLASGKEQRLCVPERLLLGDDSEE
jgi:hypothetical protein